ncbi:MAG: flagellar assembly protein FliW [Acidimicrobiaceae bacterium]|nr:flagellar assembly protein FliW [Acidimicrobiaceae bacterium]
MPNTQELELTPEGSTNDLIFQFPAGIPGYERARYFHLFKLGIEFGPYFALRCIDEGGGPVFVVAHPRDVVGDYIIEIDSEYQDRLGLERAEDALVMVVCTLGKRSTAPSANTYAPLVFNVSNGIALQVPQPGSSFELRHQLKPLFYDPTRAEKLS